MNISYSLRKVCLSCCKLRKQTILTIIPRFVYYLSTDLDRRNFEEHMLVVVHRLEDILIVDNFEVDILVEVVDKLAGIEMVDMADCSQVGVDMLVDILAEEKNR